ncbi:MAG: hypothetical protein L0228_09340 [Planctomycetes bacterium]|nr:hypothetical protein [Planctomycetota bacterium]
MPTETRPLVNSFCEPTISVFDPPSYVVASAAADALASLRHGESSIGDTRPREARTSTAAAQPGMGQDIIDGRVTFDDRTRGTFPFNPGIPMIEGM